MSQVPVPGPDLPYGTVIHPALGFHADGEDADLRPDFHLIEGLTVKFTASIKTAVRTNTASGDDITLVPSVVTGRYDASGRLRLVLPNGNLSSSDGVRLAATDDPDMVPTGWHWTVEWEGAKLPQGTFSLASGQMLNLSSVVLNSSIPNAPGPVFNDLLMAARELRDAINAGGGGGGGPADWGSLQNMPAFVAAGDTKAAARAVIDAASTASIPTRQSLGVDQVDNTSDAAKPVSTATQNALNAKANASSLAAKADKPANGGTLVQGNAGVVYKIHGFVPAGGTYPPAPDPSDADKINIFLLEMS